MVERLAKISRQSKDESAKNRPKELIQWRDTLYEKIKELNKTQLGLAGQGSLEDRRKGGRQDREALDHYSQGDIPLGYSKTRSKGQETKKIGWELELDLASTP